MVTKIKQFIEKNSKLIKNITAPFIILIFIIVSVTSAIKNSSTTDEKYHLVRGIMFLETGDLRLNQHHPILMNVIGSIPAVLNPDLVVPSTELESWKFVNKDSIAETLVEINGGSVDFSKNIVMPCRYLMIVLTGVVLYLAYLYTRKLFGWKISVLLLFLLTFDPNFIAHARLVTTDAIPSLLVYIAILGFYDFVKNHKDEKNNLKWYVFLAFLPSLALLSKYTAVFIIAIALIILMVYLFITNKKEKLLKRVAKSIIPTMIISLFIVILLTFSYKLEFKKLSEMTYDREAKLEANLNGFNKIKETSKFIGNTLEYIYVNIPLPFPQYINGFYENVFKHNIFGHSTFLLGEFSNGGWWYYFPIVFLVKEPVFVIIALLVAIAFQAFYFIKKKQKIKLEDSFLIIPPLFVLVLALNSSINLGIRHLLPVFPFMYLFIVNQLVKIKSINPVYYLVFFVLAIVVQIRIFPHYITYYNIFAGSPSDGYKIVRDSNFDWGQSRLFIDDYVKAHPNLNITISKFDYKDYDYCIVSKVDFYGNPEKYYDIVIYIKEKLATGEAEIIDEIAYTHLVIKLK